MTNSAQCQFCFAVPKYEKGSAFSFHFVVRRELKQYNNGHPKNMRNLAYNNKLKKKLMF